MKTFTKILALVITIAAVVCGILYAVYFWGLDKKIKDRVFVRKECVPDYEDIDGIDIEL